MIICCKCSRPANKKVVVRDAYGRTRDVYVCDKHEPKQNPDNPAGGK